MSSHEKYKIRLSGSGGQGVIKAAVMLAEAALVEGRNATQSQVYGPESRGGATRAEVNISDGPILFPKVENPGILLCMSPESFEKFGEDIAPGGTLILDGDVGEGTKGVKNYRIPITDTCRDLDPKGSDLSANVVALGVLNGMFDFVSRDAIVESLYRNFKKKVAELNWKFYDAGYELGKNAKPFEL